MPISTFPRHDDHEDNFLLKPAGLRDTHSEGKGTCAEIFGTDPCPEIDTSEFAQLRFIELLPLLSGISTVEIMPFQSGEKQMQVLRLTTPELKNVRGPVRSG